MDEKMTLHSSVHEVEYWKRLRVMNAMLERIRQMTALIEKIQTEDAITEQARDMAVSSLGEELAQSKLVFFDFLTGYISFGMQGLHTHDLLVSFSISEKETKVIESCQIIVDGRISRNLPAEMGLEFAEVFICRALAESGSSLSEKIISLYRSIETEFDSILGGNLGRCSLQLSEEVFPRRLLHVQIRLPAQVLLGTNSFTSEPLF